MLRLVSFASRYSRFALSDPLRRFQLSLLTLVALLVFGTVMYTLLSDDCSPIDALYMTVITIATVGYGETCELAAGGRLFTIVLIFMGVGAATSALTTAIGLAIGPALWESIRRRRLQQMIDEAKDHYIVCGYGRMGRQIIRDLLARGEPFVLVDFNEEMAHQLIEEKIPHVIGDATQDDTLYEAGIRRAKGIVAALNSDSSNIVTVLTARELNPRLFIVARVMQQESESKLRRAGANRIVNPYQIGGHRIALSLLRPAVHDFLDQIFHFGEGRDIEIGQLFVRSYSQLEGKTVATSGLRDTHNVNILAIREPTGNLTLTPAPHTEIKMNSDLIVIGPPEAIYELERKYSR